MLKSSQILQKLLSELERNTLVWGTSLHYLPHSTTRPAVTCCIHVTNHTSLKPPQESPGSHTFASSWDLIVTFLQSNSLADAAGCSQKALPKRCFSRESLSALSAPTLQHNHIDINCILGKGPSGLLGPVLFPYMKIHGSWAVWHLHKFSQLYLWYKQIGCSTKETEDGRFPSTPYSINMHEGNPQKVRITLKPQQDRNCKEVRTSRVCKRDFAKQVSNFYLFYLSLTYGWHKWINITTSILTQPLKPIPQSLSTAVGWKKCHCTSFLLDIRNNHLPLWWTGFGQAVSLLLQPLSGPPQCNCLPWNPLSCPHSQVTLSATSQRKKAPQFSTCTQVTGSREKDHCKAARIQKDRGTEHAAVSAQHLCREPFAPQFCLCLLMKIFHTRQRE